ncbi:hypothetical protein BCR37DRAFT_381148 [Protomyces lactucae-debilis]|uniref:Uncharacterized protein n=1 Tax=Protomyces lactucae-debilis TaxID=2754530 RepID=A0A1Y2F9C3_PROLT|nr:uncharacterized protein BCR37DRAFT_381148 [Protomyces lactucae-debilis]ORY80473.1 hypothetical protein BCR37DRAFT_381148 [Protomyces lactucae-debilis]
MVTPPEHKAAKYFRITVSATEKEPSGRRLSLPDSLVVIPYRGYLVAAPDGVAARLNDDELWRQAVPFELDEAIQDGDITKKRLSLATTKGKSRSADYPTQKIVIHLGQSHKLAILGLTADTNEVEEDVFSWARTADGELRPAPNGAVEETDLQSMVLACKSSGRYYELLVRDTSAYAAVEKQDVSTDCVAVTLTAEALEDAVLPTYWKSFGSD